jgi:hypothetical protein
MNCQQMILSNKKVPIWRQQQPQRNLNIFTNISNQILTNESKEEGKMGEKGGTKLLKLWV